jgi:lipoprotein-anchoring transpeptidase ErfK/SrfK
MTRARIARAILATLMLIAVTPSVASAKAFAVPGPTVRDPLDAFVTPGDTIRLSDELKVTRWAHANTSSAIRTAPQKTAPTITRLRFATEDKLPEVYLVLSAIVDAGGDVWLRIRIPMRPNGRTGWVGIDNLSQLYVVRTRLVINRSTTRATLYKEGRRIWQAPVGVGKPATPTPTGSFWVRELLKGDGKLYGSWAFGTSAYASISDWPNGGVVGIHGTDQPELIPGHPSHGCVRVRNVNINRLRLLMPIGTPIQIIG